MYFVVFHKAWKTAIRPVIKIWSSFKGENICQPSRARTPLVHPGRKAPLSFSLFYSNWKKSVYAPISFKVGRPWAWVIKQIILLSSTSVFYSVCFAHVSRLDVTSSMNHVASFHMKSSPMSQADEKCCPLWSREIDLPRVTLAWNHMQMSSQLPAVHSQVTRF